MQLQRKKQVTTSLHRQMIDNEKLYQEALHNDEQFSVLKGFKNILKELKTKLELKTPENSKFCYPLAS